MIDSLEHIFKILAPVGAGSFALLKLWLHLKFKYSKSDTTKTIIPDKERHEYLPDAEIKSIIQRVTADIANILYCMDDVLLNTDAVKVVLLKCHNGGDVPSISGPLYATVLYEVKKPNEPSTAGRWQCQPLDDAYIKMLISLFKEKKIVNETDKMVDGILKDTYMADGVSFAKVLEVFTTKGKYFYLSVLFKKQYAEVRAEERDAIRVCVNKIKNTYERNAKYV